MQRPDAIGHAGAALARANPARAPADPALDPARFVEALLGQIGFAPALDPAAAVATQRRALLNTEFVRTGAAGTGPSELLGASGRVAAAAAGSPPERRDGVSPGSEPSVTARSQRNDAHNAGPAPQDASASRPTARESTASPTPPHGHAPGSAGEGSPEPQSTGGNARTGAPIAPAGLGVPVPAAGAIGAVRTSASAGAISAGAGVSGASGAGLTGGSSSTGGSPLVVRTRPAAEHAGPTRGAEGEQRARFESQVIRGLAAALRGAGKEVTLRLTPETLGELRVRIEVEAGRVAATLEASDANARRMLEDSMPALRQALESRGLGVERIVITGGDHGGDGALAHDTPDPGEGGRAGREPAHDRDDADERMELDAGPDGAGTPLAEYQAGVVGTVSLGIDAVA